MNRQQVLDERFWSRVDRSGSGCWPWLGNADKDGYGRFGFRQDGESTSRRAPRFAYESVVGPIPDGLQIDHLCRNRICVRPEHLETVTPRENWLRGLAPSVFNARKTHCNNGHPYDAVNTYWTGRGRQRQCRTCLRAASRRYYARTKAQSA